MTTKMGELGVVNSKGTVFTEDEHLGLGLRWKFPPPPDPASIAAECFSAAEEAAEQVLNCVHPTLDSEEKRRDVIDYIQQLIKSHLSCEVVSYGSVPLKTYLPDGDIDLTVLKGCNAEESLAHDVLARLQDEEQNENAEYQIKDTHFIDAEVKLVKCLVRNIVIDISFNQLGGLSTLCFLEQVDRLIGKNHLFKRSIILVKTWCYYESRILGAYHGLISTYALETLILYIFNLFHSSLSDPLSVLYRFLDYYSQFDWENYCISLNGPVCKSSLPNIVVKMPESGLDDQLLSRSFLKSCIEMFSVPSGGLESNPKAFQIKHLNIIDPLKENNNLGRSVNRGNFYRIQSAFKYGAHKLVQVLLQPRDKVADEINEFFANTRARHVHHYKSSIRHLDLEFDNEASVTTSLSSHVENLSEDDILLNSSVDDFDNDGVDGDELDIYSIREVSPEMASEASCLVDGALIIGQHCLFRDKHSLATSNSGFRKDTADCVASSDCGASDNHFKSSVENGSSESHHTAVSCSSEKFGYSEEINNTHQWCLDNSEVVCIPGSSANPKVHIFENRSLDFEENDSTSIGGESEAFNPLADLGGDYDSHIRSLLCGQLCYFPGLSASVTCNPPSSPSRTQNKRPWDVVRRSMPLVQNKPSQTDSYSGHVVLSGADSAFLGTSFQFEGKQKARGTGTFFPNMNVVHMEMPSCGRGRNTAPGDYNHLRRSNSFEISSHEVPSARSRYQGGRKRLDVHRQSPRSAQIKRCLSSSCRIEFGSIGNIAEELLSSSTQELSLKTHGSTTVVMQERIAGSAIHLKNEDEFPPLCH